MRALHLFDRYLPHTMNWAYRLMRATPGVQCAVAAPWIIENQYYTREFEFHRSPVQVMRPTDEWQYWHLAGFLMRAELRLPFYRAWLAGRLQQRPAPDVLHAHFGQLGVHYLPLARALRRPLVVSFYGYDFVQLPTRRPAYRGRYRQLFAEAAAVICQGEYGKNVLVRQLGCPPQKVTVLPLGVDCRQFQFQERHKPAGRLRLLQAATITEKKGYRTTLEAVALARRECPDLHLTVCGEAIDRPLARALRDYVRAHGLENQVRFVDFVGHAGMPGLFAGFDALIHPSCHTPDGDFEGGPVVILEAQAAGLPVLATRHADIPAEVLDGQSGLLAPERDAAALAAHIERMYWMENDEYQAFSRAGRAHVEENYALESMGVRLAALYRRVTRLDL